MIGFIVKHAVFGVGKIIEWNFVGREPFKVRFQTAESQCQDVCFDKLTLGRQIARTVLPPGSRCRTDRGGCLVIDISKFPANGCLAEYEVEFEDASGLRAAVPESSLELRELAAVQDPALLLGGLQAGGYPIFGARERLTNVLYRMLRDGNGLRALLASRVDLRPHQAYVAGVVLLDRRRRYLLADEVGLGKTVEAGIILVDLLAQRPDASVLILAPGTLTQQWLCELYAKFGQDTFVMPDLRGGSIDWSKIPRAIISMSRALVAAPALKARHWDLVIADEAHHLLGPGAIYDLAMALSERANGLLLLSALPAQERKDEFRRLLALLDPTRYSAMPAAEFAALYDAQQDVGRKIRLVSRRLQDFESGNGSAGEVFKKVFGLLDLPATRDDVALRSAIDGLAVSADTADAARAAGAGSQSVAPFRDGCQRLLHYVGDTYRINRRILRNRRQRLAEDAQIKLITRRFEELDYEPDQLEIDAAQAVQSLLVQLKSTPLPDDLLIQLARLAYQSLSYPIAAVAVLRQLTSARRDPVSSSVLLTNSHLVGYSDWDDYLTALLRSVRRFCDNDLLAAAFDAAVAWAADVSGSTRLNRLVEFLNSRQSVARLRGAARAAPVKVLMFAGFPGVAADIAARLQAKIAPDAVAIFHNAMSREDKERSVTRFRTNARTCILVCDETGGEGRNFQFASEIVHFDTPWYASRVEQRIGRLDRLGRERELNPDVVSNVLYNRWSVEAGLVRCFGDGLGVYTQSLSGLEFALRDVERALAEAAMAGGAGAMESMIPKIREKADEERARDESDAVLDAASFERATADRYWRVSDSAAVETDLETAFTDYFRMISSQGAVRPQNDERTPEGVWLLSPAEVREVKLQVEPDPETGSPPPRRGTFRRAVAQARCDLDFFSVGNVLFDAVVASMTRATIGRTYAVECLVPGAPPWIGFEVVLTATALLSCLDDEEIGLRNRARQVIHHRPAHVFVAADGTVVDTTTTEQLLRVRQSLGRETKDRGWWNLTKEKSQFMHRAFPDGRLQHATLEAQTKARDVARQQFTDRLASHLDEESRRVDELIRLARAETSVKLDQKRGNVASVEAEVQALEDYRRAVGGWVVNVDAIGFLSINGGLRS